MDETERARLREHLALVSPGTALRDGLDRIVHGRTGALIVLGCNPEVASLVTGGFAIDAPLSATALRELAKMDGAILLDEHLTRITHAGAHLMPDASVPTSETGTRHRTAERVSRQTGVAVVTVSASMSSIALFLAGARYPLHHPEHLLVRANQGLATLTRYRDRLSQAARHLTSLEIQDTVTVGDVALVARRLEMVRRLGADIDDEVIELGIDGRLVELQLQELLTGVDLLSSSLARDYGTGEGQLALDRLRGLATDQLLDQSLVARTMELVPGSLDARVPARGYRQLSQIARLPADVADRLVDHFGSLQALLGASTTELVSVPEVDYGVARRLREGLARLTETSYHAPAELPS